MWTVAIDTDMRELKVMELYCHALFDKRDYLDFHQGRSDYGCVCQTLMLPITFELQELEFLLP